METHRITPSSVVARPDLLWGATRARLAERRRCMNTRLNGAQADSIWAVSSWLRSTSTGVLTDGRLYFSGRG